MPPRRRNLLPYADVRKVPAVVFEEYLHPNNDHLLCELDPRHISLKHHARIQPPNRKNDNTKHSSSSEHTNITLRQQKASVSIVPSLLPKLPIDKADVYSRLRSQLLYPRNLRGMARVYDVERRLESDMITKFDGLADLQKEAMRSLLKTHKYTRRRMGDVVTDPKDPANTDWLFIETPKYLSETDLLNNNGGASVGRGNQHDGNVTLPLIPSERGSVSNGPQSRKKSITVQMTASSSNGAGGIIEFPVIRAPTISSEEEAKAKEHSANKMAARRPSILPQQMESQIMLAGGGTSRRKQELTPSQKYSTFRTSQQALSKSIGSKSMSKTRDEAMKQNLKLITIQLQEWVINNLETPVYLKDPLEKEPVEEIMNGSMRSGLDATARKKSNGKLLPSNNALSKNQNGHSHANLLLATGGGAGGTGEKGDLIDQQLLRHGKEISISHESLPANHGLPDGAMESVNEFDILLSAYQPKTIENESSGGVAGFRVQANREANPPPALIKSLKTHLGVQISFVSQEQEKPRHLPEEKLSRKMNKRQLSTAQKRMDYGAWFTTPTEWQNLSENRYRKMIDPDGSIEKRQLLQPRDTMQKTLEEIMSKRHREGLASTVAGMSIMTSSSPQTSRSSTANPPAHRV